MSTVFVIGNGESRLMFPIQTLKDNGVIYGCNAIYRDHPDLCEKIFAVNEGMYEELLDAKDKQKTTSEIVGINDISDWNYILPGDDNAEIPEGLKLYRMWQGGDAKRGIYKTRDFSLNRGSGCSAVLHAAEQGFTNICILGFDILGARQYEMSDQYAMFSREQNNIYKNTANYPQRVSMKAYLKYEWLFQLTQICRKFKDTNFYFFNRLENIHLNPFLRPYFTYAGGNIRAGSYADLKRLVDGKKDDIKWII
jgi:hypothetical protein